MGRTSRSTGRATQSKESGDRAVGTSVGHRRKRQRQEGNSSGLRTVNSTALDPPQADFVFCACCKESISSNDDYVETHPCDHVLCTACALRSQIKRGSKPHRCPVTSCNCYSSHTRYCHGISERGRTKPVEVMHNTIAGSDDYIKYNLPIEWVKMEHRNELKSDRDNQAVVLLAAKAQVNAHGLLEINRVTSTIVLQKKKKGPPRVLNHNRALVRIQNFLAFLHYPILQASNTAEKHLPVMGPRELLEFRCKHRLLVDAALFSMATGSVQFDDSLYLAKDSSDHLKHLLSVITSADLMLRNVRDMPGYFQLMFGELLQRQKNTKEFRDLCSILNLAPSRKFTLKHRAKEVLKQLNEGLTLHPRDLVLVFFDNIGFKILGRQASYDQWILVKIVVVTEADLKDAGFYCNEMVDQQISPIPSADWSEEVNNVTTLVEMHELAESIIGIKEDDHQRFSECVLEDIQFAIDNKEKLALSDQNMPIKLPRFDRIVNRQTRIQMEQLQRSGVDVSRHQPPTRLAQASSVILPRDYMPTDVTNEISGNGLQRHVDGADIDANEPEEEEPGRESSKSCLNQYERNNAKLEVVYSDLSEKSSVDSLMAYALKSSKNQLQNWEDIKHKYPDNAEKPLADIMVGLGTDGQPAAQARRLLAEDASFGGDRLYPDTMFVSFGGFHSVMKTLNANGEYFEELLRYFFDVYRNTTEKVKWVLLPSDPRQREEEYPWLMLANYSRAAAHLEAHLKRPVSAVEVNDFMLERAKEYPICALALLELRMGTVAKIMRNAERIGKRGSVAMFLTALKFALPIFAVTHKSDYVFLCQDLLRWYHCASPAVRKIYESQIFTQLTAHGKSIFHDTSVELSVKDVRDDAGKVYRPGMETSMEIIAVTKPKTAGSNDVATSLKNNNTKATTSSRSKTCSTLSTNIACPYYKVATKIDEIFLWTPGKQPVIICKSGKTIQCTEDIIELPSGQLHADILSAPTNLGRRRSLDHFIEYHIKGDAASTRSDKVVDLSRVKTTTSGIKEELEQQTILATSTTVSDFDKQVYSKGRLLAEIDKLRDREKKRKHKRDRIDIPPIAVGEKKSAIAKHLVKYRTKVFDKYPTLSDDISKSIKDSFAERGLSTKESRIDILEDQFFTLSQSVRSSARYNTKTHNE